MEVYEYLMSAPRLVVCVCVCVCSATCPSPHWLLSWGPTQRARRGDWVEEEEEEEEEEEKKKKKKKKKSGGGEPFPSLSLGQYKTSLLGCHRTFVHFLLHLAAILLDKHCSRFVPF